MNKARGLAGRYFKRDSDAPILETLPSSMSSQYSLSETSQVPENDARDSQRYRQPYRSMESPSLDSAALDIDMGPSIAELSMKYPAVPEISSMTSTQVSNDFSHRLLQKTGSGFHSLYPENSDRAYLYDHDMVLIFARQTGGERKDPNEYSMGAFVALMLGIDEDKSRKVGYLVSDAFHRVLRTKRCFISESHVDHHDRMSLFHEFSEHFQSEQKQLEKEYQAFTGSTENTTQLIFSELVASAIARRLQVTCGLTTRMFLSCDGDEIFMTIRADDSDLRMEADRIGYKLQVSNKPFDNSQHQSKIELLNAELTKSDWINSIHHLEKTRRYPEKASGSFPEVDPLLNREGEQYHPKLYKALKKWGHTEEADSQHHLTASTNLLERRKEEINTGSWFRKIWMLAQAYDPMTYFAPYAEYKSESIYQPYYRRYPIEWNGIREETLFAQKDRIRLTSSIVSRHINVDALQVSKYLESAFAMHDPVALSDLRATWALRWSMVHQPVQKIRFYFGEKVAIYFAWLGFYTKLLLIATIAGIITEIVGIRNLSVSIKEKNKSVQPYILIAFAVFIVIWGTLVAEVWKKKNAVLNAAWGYYHSNIHSKYRPQFRGVKSYNPKTDDEELTYPSKLRRRRTFAISVAVVIAMVAIVLIALVFLFFLKFWINDGRLFGMDITAGYKKPLTLVVTGINAVQILAFNSVYRWVAINLNDWENHRTEFEYENHLIWKVFLFQFCNSFASFFYIAFFKRSIEGQCIKDNCMQELRDQLLVLFLIRIVIGNTLEVVIPYLKHQFALFQERKAFKKGTSYSDDTNDETNSRHNIVEKQAKLIPYERNEAFEDYNELIIQFGFVTLFVVAFPLTPLLAFVNNVAEVHVDAVKLCYVHRRPFPHPAKDIGAWFYILRIMIIIAIGTNSAIVLYTADQLFDFELSATNRACIYVVCCQVGLFLVLLISRMIPKEEDELTQLMRRQEYIEACVFKGMHNGDDSTTFETAEKLDLKIYPNNQWRETRAVSHV